MEKVILVDKNDNQIGVEEKMKVHEDGLLHRAFSIIVFNTQNEMLLHRRALGKYHCPGLWTNACCSHPRPGENLATAIDRRLEEEMGFSCDLKEVFNFSYLADFDNGLTENEYDHVFVGKFDGSPKPNPKEVDDWKWMPVDDLKKDISENPNSYTPWFRIVIEDHFDKVMSSWTLIQNLRDTG